MKNPTHISLVSARLLLAGVAFSSAAAMAQTVSMPTPQGNSSYNSAAFANAFLAAPSGDFTCFTGGALAACNPALLQLALLGPDLTTGLTLDLSAEVTLAFAGAGTSLYIWEAAGYDAAGGAGSMMLSVHTATGWSDSRLFGPDRLVSVRDDTRPSGYATLLGIYSWADFGFAAPTSFDAVRIRSCCGTATHPDLLAIAVVPESRSAAMMLAGLLTVGMILRRRRA
jgi:hypothetical protein